MTTTLPGQQPTYSYQVEHFELHERPRRFLEAFGAILEHSNYGVVLDYYANVSTKCARCTATCPVYQITNEVRDIPCNRTELLLKIYRRYFTVKGQLLSRFWDGFHLADSHIDELAEEMYRCTACRRCKSSCPMGIDHGLVTHLSRWILAEIGISPRALVVSVREQLEGKTRNTSAIPVIAMKDSCEFLEEELEEELGEEYPEEKIRFPIDEEGAEYVFIPPVSDFLMEAETLMGNAAAFHAMGLSWTIGTGSFDAIDYGLFYSDRMWARIIKAQVAEIKRLGGKYMLIGECGHASRAAREGMQNFIPPEDRYPVVNCLDLAYRMFKQGRLQLKKGVIKERTTYHDPCNIARTGWIVDQPRELLRHICADFVEMTPKGRDNYCCGGGGGTVSIDEIKPFRMDIGGKIKAEQIQATEAKYIVAPCANCKKQIDELIEYHDIDIERVGLHDLLMKAIIFSESACSQNKKTP